MPSNQSNHWLNHAIIYQLFAGRWPGANIINHPSQVFSRLAAYDFSLLSQQGINCLYLLGVFDNRGPIIVGEENGQDITHRPHRFPSPFAITNHQNTNPDLGSIFALQDLINSLHTQGIKVLLDFVPNHTGTTHSWVKNHPDYYQQKNGNHLAEFSGDVYKLDYSNPQLRQEMISVLQTIAGWGTDGVRCDMAHLVPLDFWQQAIQTIKSTYPYFVFTAEVYPNSPFDLSVLHNHLQAGFDAVYHGPLHKNLDAIITHHQPLENLINHLNFILKDFQPGSLINYLSNHDDPLAEGGGDYLESLLALTLFLPGVPFIYNGLLNGLSRRLAHHYFDQLEDQYLETNSIPSNMSQLLQYRIKHNPIITSVSLKDHQLLCRLQTDSGPQKLLVNFQQPQPVQFSN